MHEIDQMPQVTADPVELPGDQGVALAQTLQAGVQPGPVVAFAGRMILVEAVGCDAGRKQRIALQVEHLRSVCLAYAHVTDQHHDFRS